MSDCSEPLEAFEVNPELLEWGDQLDACNACHAASSLALGSPRTGSPQEQEGAPVSSISVPQVAPVATTSVTAKIPNTHEPACLREGTLKCSGDACSAPFVGMHDELLDGSNACADMLHYPPREGCEGGSKPTCKKHPASEFPARSGGKPMLSGITGMPCH
jgi:hypothetical protein